MHFRELTERYRLDKILRSARTGTVLRALDSRSGRPVAIKLITVASAAALTEKAPQLEKLGAALEGLRHPGLPVVIDSGLDAEGSAFLVMELLDGQTLDALGGTPQRILGLLFQVVDGLEALARHGIAHHNVSPDNVFVVSAPQGERAKLLGLGSALFHPEPPVGTGRLRAPEQAGAGGAGWPADLYSFALTACHLLGASVQPGEPPVVQMPFTLTLGLERIDAFAGILERCLRRDPGERPSHQEIRDAIRLALGGGVPAPPPDPERSEAPLLVLPRPVQAAAPPPAPVEGEVLSTVDDEVLDALVAPPPPPPAESPPASPPVVSIRPARNRIALAACLVLAVLAGVALGVWWLDREQAPPPPVAKRAAPPQPQPRRPASKVVTEAQLALAAGSDDQAFQALRSLTFADQAGLSSEGCRTLQGLEETLAIVALERLPGDLERGLRTGDLGRLRFAVAAAAGQEASLPEGLRAGLARAREAADLYGQAEAAAERKAHAEVLERFAELTGRLPGASDPLELRNRAASVLEDESEALVREGRYADALARLEPLRRTWPDREGLRERVASTERWQKAETGQAALLALLPAAERRRKPHEALERLEGIEPTPHLAPRFAEARRRLEAQLAHLDQAPPQVTLREGYALDYDQGMVVELSFRVKDDYMVRSVKLMARPEGGKMRELPLEKSTFGYDVEIPSSFHRNGTVELYVVATDTSGHEGFFGTPDKPQQARRR